MVEDGEAVTDAIARRRFAEMQLIGVYAAEVADAAVSLIQASTPKNEGFAPSV